MAWTQSATHCASPVSALPKRLKKKTEGGSLRERSKEEAGSGEELRKNTHEVQGQEM